jgi:hypothetical protein
MSTENVILRVRVTNLETNISYVHNRVPINDVEILRLSPNLKIEILGQSRSEDEKPTVVRA